MTYELVEDDIIARDTYNQTLYHDDNALLYFYLKEATRSTMYTSSIQPYSRRKDGSGAWFPITNQYARKDKWGDKLKKQMTYFTPTSGKYNLIYRWKIVSLNTKKP